MKNAFDGLTCRGDMAKERISENKDTQWKFPKLKSKEKNMENNRTEYPRTMEQLQKV